MKIIHTDNFGGDFPDEKFVEGLPSLNENQAKAICDAINAQIDPNGPRYYLVVADDYQLQPGFEP